ncbi:type IV toxin-antitoxin system AbiEi family antitoxin domain-containing protein [Microbacterium sp. NPDC057659]|uniref:type IV toxin-antitoxin system AbiEi family antitoxin domain-containing protein n=1 Tax=Microbacterium sp. NPDC057659 TaxID=3346198 RepID=UPI00366AB9C9
MSVVSVLSAFGRIARTSELKTRGVTERELTSAVRSGEITRIRQGLYALPGIDPVMMHAAEHGGVPGCTDAGRMHGLWILEGGERHVWLGTAGNEHGACKGCRLHWDEGLVKVGQLPPVHNVLLQIAECSGEETFFAAYESALRWSKISPGGIAWLWKHLPVRMRWLLDFARGDADSGLESLVRLRLHRSGISLRRQISIRGVGEVDFVYGGWLIIECDGRDNHEREKERHKDLMRDAAAAARGYETLRFDYAMIVHDWGVVEAAILAKVRSGSAGLRRESQTVRPPDGVSAPQIAQHASPRASNP